MRKRKNDWIARGTVFNEGLFEVVVHRDGISRIYFPCNSPHLSRTILALNHFERLLEAAKRFILAHYTAEETVLAEDLHAAMVATDEEIAAGGDFVCVLKDIEREAR